MSKGWRIEFEFNKDKNMLSSMTLGESLPGRLAPWTYLKVPNYPPVGLMLIYICPCMICLATLNATVTNNVNKLLFVI